MQAAANSGRVTLAPRLDQVATTRSAIAASIIIPTLREAQNLKNLLPLVSQALAEDKITHEIIIVDDNSNDGTEELIASLAQTLPVRLLIRTNERGLGSAVVHGFAHAHGDIIVCMDADLSHPPAALPDLIRPLLHDAADFVIGSRYVPGGSIDSHWSRWRRVNSSVARWMARPLASAQDPGSGFFALRRQAYVDAATTLNTLGFKIGLELIVKTAPRRCMEVPIHFTDRRAGTSKLGARQQTEYVRQLMQLMAYRTTHRTRRSIMIAAITR